MPQPKIGQKVFGEHASREKPTEGIDPLDPETCATELLEWLPEHVRNKIIEAAKQMALPRWQMLLGYAMRMDEMGELFVPYILHSPVTGMKTFARFVENSGGFGVHHTFWRISLRIRSYGRSPP